MSEPRYSSKKYGDYPIILDKEKELTLDSVVDKLNDYEWKEKNYIEEFNRLHRDVKYLSEQKREDNSKLYKIIKILGVIIVIEFIVIIWVI